MGRDSFTQRCLRGWMCHSSSSSEVELTWLHIIGIGVICFLPIHYIVLKAFLGNVPHPLPVSHWQTMMVLASLSILACVVLAVVRVAIAVPLIGLGLNIWVLFGAVYVAAEKHGLSW